jgi:hypothetical protein
MKPKSVPFPHLSAWQVNSSFQVRKFPFCYTQKGPDITEPERINLCSKSEPLTSSSLTDIWATQTQLG